MDIGWDAPRPLSYSPSIVTIHFSGCCRRVAIPWGSIGLKLDMGADGIYVGGGVNPQNRAAAAASVGVAAAAFNPGGGGGADTI